MMIHLLCSALTRDLCVFAGPSAHDRGARARRPLGRACEHPKAIHALYPLCVSLLIPRGKKASLENTTSHLPPPPPKVESDISIDCDCDDEEGADGTTAAAGAALQSAPVDARAGPEAAAALQAELAANRKLLANAHALAGE